MSKGILRCAWIVSVILLSSGSPASAQAPTQLPEAVIKYADLVLYNGKIHTVDRDDANYSIVQAVAIRDGRFLAVGSDKDALALAGPSTVKVDLKGRTVVPGFIDTHSHLFPLPPREQRARYGRFRLSARNVEEKQKALQEISEFAKGRKPGEWIVTGTSNDLVRAFTIQELDQAAPRNPLFIGGTPSVGAVNSLALKELLSLYPEIEGVFRDEQGKPTGQVETPAVGLIQQEVIPDPPAEVMGPAYKEAIDSWARAGITTWSSRITGAQLTNYIWLDRRGMMTTRLAYSHQWLMDNPDYRAYVKRLGDFVGLGNEMIWNIGASVVSIDGSTPDQCVSLEKRKPAGFSGPFGDCRAFPGMPRYEAYKEALSNGIRVSGVHAAGDKSIDKILDLFLELNKERNLKDLRLNLDHCTMVSPDNVRKASRVPGLMFSCAPKYVFSTAKEVADIWGKEIAHRWVVPVKSLLDAGIKVVWEIDTSEHFKGFPQYHPMLQMQVLVTRMDEDGNVWGPRESIDRRTALLMMTRWAAEYVLREKDLGSIEVGKMTDLAVLDGDLLGAADNDLIKLATLMTMVGGKIVYADPEFVNEIGPAHERILHKYATKHPAYRPSKEVLDWAAKYKPAS